MTVDQFITELLAAAKQVEIQEPQIPEGLQELLIVRPPHPVFDADASPKTQELRIVFDALSKKWCRETRHTSSISKMITHPAYLRIIGMGRDVLPLLFNELRERPDHWLVALNAIIGEDPASEESTFEQAVEAWLAWGRGKGYLK